MPTIRALPTTLVLVLLLILSVGSVSAQVSCGAVLTGNTTLNQDLTCAGDGLWIGADGVTLDCAGHTISGDSGALGTAGVHVAGVSDVTIARCIVTGFRRAVLAENARGLQITETALLDNGGGIFCTGCPGASIQGNQLHRQFTQINFTESPDTRILNNEFSAHPRGGSSIILRYSPRASVLHNSGPHGGAQILLDRCEDSNVEDNNFSGSATVWLIGCDRSLVTRNVLVRGTATLGSAGGFVQLTGTNDTLVAGNVLEGGRGIFLIGDRLDLPAGGATMGGADRNVIQDNVIRDSNFAVLLFGASNNRVARNTILGARNGVAIARLLDLDTGFEVPGDRNLIEANVIRDGVQGIWTWRASENHFNDNLIVDHWIGMLEGPLGRFSSSPNQYSENSISGNRLFGLISLGGSPILERNEFRGNGSMAQAPAELEPYLSLLGDLRGGIALLPMAGDDLELDNGVPGDDLIGRPMIGGPGKKNLFSNNADVDIFALDTRAANAATLERDNHYKGEAATRIRQDWFGLVRVEDGDGNPVPDAVVEVRDASGAIVSRFTTGSSGFGPASVDPDRSQGRAQRWEGKPAIPWPRLTEYVIDGGGRRQDSTPHRVTVEASGQTGCVTFAWDGKPAEPPGSASPLVRYQSVVVRLGSVCDTAALHPGTSSR